MESNPPILNLQYDKRFLNRVKYQARGLQAISPPRVEGRIGRITVESLLLATKYLIIVFAVKARIVVFRTNCYMTRWSQKNPQCYDGGAFLFVFLFVVNVLLKNMHQLLFISVQDARSTTIICKSYPRCDVIKWSQKLTVMITELFLFVCLFCLAISLFFLFYFLETTLLH